jgi:hypothetical protein
MFALSRLLAAAGLASSLAVAASQALAQAAAPDSPSAASIKSLQSRDAKEAAGRDARDARDTTTGTKANAAAPKDAAVSTTVPRQRRPVLRCWQEGRLVYEGAGVVPSSQGVAAIELRNASGTAVQVFDLKNGLCLLDHGGE